MTKKKQNNPLTTPPKCAAHTDRRQFDLQSLPAQGPQGSETNPQRASFALADRKQAHFPDLPVSGCCQNTPAKQPQSVESVQTM